MNFIYVIHLMCWNYLVDLITHNRNIRGNQTTAGTETTKEGAREARAASVASMISVVSVM